MKKRVLTIVHIWMRMAKHKIPVSGGARSILSRFGVFSVKMESESEEELRFSIEEFLGTDTVVITIENGKLATLQEGETSSFTLKDEHGHTLVIQHAIPHQKHLPGIWDDTVA